MHSKMEDDELFVDLVRRKTATKAKAKVKMHAKGARAEKVSAGKDGKSRKHRKQDEMEKSARTKHELKTGINEASADLWREAYQVTKRELDKEKQDPMRVSLVEVIRDTQERAKHAEARADDLKIGMAKARVSDLPGKCEQFISGPGNGFNSD